MKIKSEFCAIQELKLIFLWHAESSSIKLIEFRNNFDFRFLLMNVNSSQINILLKIFEKVDYWLFRIYFLQHRLNSIRSSKIYSLETRFSYINTSRFREKLKWIFVSKKIFFITNWFLWLFFYSMNVVTQFVWNFCVHIWIILVSVE